MSKWNIQLHCLQYNSTRRYICTSLREAMETRLLWCNIWWYEKAEVVYTLTLCAQFWHHGSYKTALGMDHLKSAWVGKVKEQNKNHARECDWKRNHAKQKWRKKTILQSELHCCAYKLYLPGYGTLATILNRILYTWNLATLLACKLAATLYCIANSSWTLVAKQPCEKTLMDNHVFKAITKKYGLSTVILLDLFAFKQYKRNLGNIGVISQLTCINDNCGHREL